MTTGPPYRHVAAPVIRTLYTPVAERLPLPFLSRPTAASFLGSSRNAQRLKSLGFEPDDEVLAPSPESNPVPI
jgi:hypothetical protein